MCASRIPTPFHGRGKHFLDRLLPGWSRDVNSRELLTGSSLAFALRLSGRLLSLLFVYIVNRMFGADAFGEFSYALAMLFVLVIVTKLGFDISLVKLVAEYNAPGKQGALRGIYCKIMLVLLGVSILVCLLLLILSQFLDFTNFSRSSRFLVAVGVVPFTLLVANVSALRGLKKVFQSNLVESFLFFFLPILLLHPLQGRVPEGVNVPLAALVVSIFLLCGLSFVLWGRYLQTFSREKSETMGLRQLLSLSLPLALATSLLHLMVWSDLVMLGLFNVSQADIGAYSIALRVAFFINFPVMSIASITLPKFSELFGQKRQEEFARFTVDSARLSFWTSFPLALGLILIGPWILEMFDEQFLHSYLPYVLLCCGNLVNAMASCACSILIMTNKHKLLQWILATGTILNILLNLALIPAFGPLGTAIASCFSLTVWNVIAVIMVRRLYKLSTLYFPGMQLLAMKS